MLALDQNALVCDLAEEYHIYDYKSLPCKTVATLSFGLREDSRIKRKISGINVATDHLLLASIADRIGELEWMQTKDGAKGRNRPGSILKWMLGEDEKEKEIESYNSGEEFLEARKKIIEGSEEK